MKLRTILLSAAAGLLTGMLAAQAQVPGVNSTLNSVFTLAYDNSTMKQTYSATVAGVVATPAPGDVCSLYGSATKNIRLRRVIFSALVSGALAMDPVAVVKRSSIAIGGTLFTTMPFTATPYDSSNAAATATVEAYSTVPTTTGTLVGVLADIYITLPGATTSVVQTGPTVFEFGKLGQPIVLRGVAEHVDVNNAFGLGTTQACTFEWTEES